MYNTDIQRAACQDEPYRRELDVASNASKLLSFPYIFIFNLTVFMHIVHVRMCFCTEYLGLKNENIFLFWKLFTVWVRLLSQLSCHTEHPEIHIETFNLYFPHLFLGLHFLIIRTSFFRIGISTTFIYVSHKLLLNLVNGSYMFDIQWQWHLWIACSSVLYSRSQPHPNFNTLLEFT